MISYYKKVFLSLIRFGFLDALLGFGGKLLTSAVGGFAGAAGSSVGSSITGGSSSDPNADIMAQHEKEKNLI